MISKPYPHPEECPKGASRRTQGGYAAPSSQFSPSLDCSIHPTGLRGQEEPWTADRLSAFAPADVVIHLSLEIARSKRYPAVELQTSRSRLIETKSVSDEHATL
jgi:hypothetical protein